MQPTREDAFPSTCFSLNQNRAIGFRDLFRNVSQLRNGMAYTKKWICSLSACLRFFNQPALAISAVFQTSFHQNQQIRPRLPPKTFCFGTASTAGDLHAILLEDFLNGAQEISLVIYEEYARLLHRNKSCR